MWIPIDAIFRGGDSSQTPVSPSMRVASSVERRQRPDQRLLEVAAVAPHVLPVPGQVEDRVADELPGRVVGRLAAAVDLDDRDVGAVRHVQLSLLGAAAERDRRRVLEEEDGVGARAAARPRRRSCAAGPTPRGTSTVPRFEQVRRAAHSSEACRRGGVGGREHAVPEPVAEQRLRPTISRATVYQVARARVPAALVSITRATRSGSPPRRASTATLVGVHRRRRDERVEADVRPVVGRCLCELAGGGGGELGAEIPGSRRLDRTRPPRSAVRRRTPRRVFRRVVRGGAGKGELAAHRADVDDATASLAAHARQDEAAQLHRREDVRLELTLHAVGRDDSNAPDWL